MEAHAHAISSSGGDVLNVGFGLGLIDEVSSFKHTCTQFWSVLLFQSLIQPLLIEGFDVVPSYRPFKRRFAGLQPRPNPKYAATVLIKA